jgi:hypothetical protein
MEARVQLQNIPKKMRSRRREVDPALENNPCPGPGLGPGLAIGSEVEAEKDVTDIGTNLFPSPKMRKRPSAADREEKNVVVAARKKEMTAMTLDLEIGHSMTEKQMLTVIDRDQPHLLIRNARATEAVETKTSTESGSETVIESTDRPINTAQATALIEMIDPEVETVIETVSTAIAIAVADLRTLTPRLSKKLKARLHLLPSNPRTPPTDPHRYPMVQTA